MRYRSQAAAQTGLDEKGRGRGLCPGPIRGHPVASPELKSTFLSSVRVGARVTCRCAPAHLGRQAHVWDATVSNETTGKTMALFRCTQIVLLPR